ncbi:HAMP domain-containing sensor histidine kinase [Paenibacillus filicis]|uniref:histidine kinase n=1 Tax=Paenibacillus filicis TaxID=669464 RepID=A0ABU9DTA6_9BACL
MGTKWRNKAVAIGGWILLVAVTSAGILIALDIGRLQASLSKSSYWKPNLYNQAIFNVRDIVKYRVDFKDFDSLSDQEKLGGQLEGLKNELKEEVAQTSWNAEFEYPVGLVSKFQEQSRESYRMLLRLLVEQKILGKKNEWDPEWEAAWNAMYPQLALVRLKELEAEYRHVKQAVGWIDGIVTYTLTDLQTSRVYTNRQSGLEAEQPLTNTREVRTLVFPLTASSDDVGLNELSAYFEQNHLKGIFSFNAAVKPKNEANGINMSFYEDYIGRFQTIERIREGLRSLAGCLILAVVLLVYTKRSKVRQNLAIQWSTIYRKRIPVELRIGILLCVSLGLLSQFWTKFIDAPDYLFFQPVNWLPLSCLIGYLSIGFRDIRMWWKGRAPSSEQGEGSLLVRSLHSIRSPWLVRSLLWKTLLILGLTALVGPAISMARENGVLYGMESRAWIPLSYVILYTVTVIPYVLVQIGVLSRMMAGVREMAAGNLSVEIPEGQGKGELEQMVRQLSGLQAGFRSALEERLTSERLKTELITNVSHDLKTPLTSMISYITLLQSDELEPEERGRYIQVLDRKSQRLKVLIDDLFEVSKLASGAVEPVLEPVNLAALLQQAVAEFSDRLEAADLRVVLDLGPSPAIAMLDGKKAWRVLENLLQNVLNYSLSGTRVHIKLEEEADCVCLRLSNVSAYPIDFDPQELFERFKRGDQSRHTEGSGLGLAIARSIMELQGGQLRIDIDGDYFKAVAIFRKPAPAREE